MPRDSYAVALLKPIQKRRTRCHGILLQQLLRNKRLTTRGLTLICRRSRLRGKD